MEKLNKQSQMYTSLPNLIIGFHGCDQITYENVLYKHSKLKPSVNDYDWLGNGIYFWEQNLKRAWEWARNNRKINEPAVIGAVIDLGYCLNLLDSNYIKMLKKEYELLEVEFNNCHKIIPVNKNINGNKDLLLRYLDCLVIEHLHDTRELAEAIPFDSVRGVFLEGEPIYSTSGFCEQSHIQICIRNPNCIKGLFSPMEVDMDWRIP